MTLPKYLLEFQSTCSTIICLSFVSAELQVSVILNAQQKKKKEKKKQNEAKK